MRLRAAAAALSSAVAAMLAIAGPAAASDARAAGGAAQHSESETSGSVTATVSWRGNYAETKDFRIAIDRDGVRVLDEKVRTEACPGGGSPGFACPWPPPGDALDLADLEGDGDPEAAVAGFTGGAHCCLVAIVYRWNGTAYVAAEHNFLDAGYDVEDLDGDGRFEFSSLDARFAYLYGSFAESVFPVLVMRFGAGKFTDVTAEFESVVAKDLKRVKREYRRRAETKRKLGVRAALAAYVADLYRLGRGDDARRVLRSALERGLLDRRRRFDVGPFRKRFIRNLKRHLRRWDYI